MFTPGRAILSAEETDNHYYFQFTAISLMIALIVWGIVEVIAHARADLYLWIAIMVFLAYLLADFISGFVHWLADRYGTEETILVGPNFVKPFRMHHIDRKGITRHNFVKANGNNSIVTIPFLIMCHAVVDFDYASSAEIVLFSGGLALSIWIYATNQFHKWAHEDEVSPFISKLQNMGLILSKKEHDKHHVFPHETNYCITSGILNPTLEKIRFWYFLEWLIYTLLRQKPFHDSQLNSE